MNLIFGIILLAAALFLIVAVLLQSGKDNNMSGAIAGGAETFFGKTKGKTNDRILNKLTTIVAVVFVLLVIVVYVIQPDTVFDANKEFDKIMAADQGDKEETKAPETEASTSDTDAETSKGGEETDESSAGTTEPDETDA